LGSKADNRTIVGVVALVSNESADVGISPFMVTKERSEFLAYTDPLGIIR
jgi:hypothetical protein